MRESEGIKASHLKQQQQQQEKRCMDFYCVLFSQSLWGVIFCRLNIPITPLLWLTQAVEIMWSAFGKWGSMGFFCHTAIMPTSTVDIEQRLMKWNHLIKPFSVINISEANKHTDNTADRLKLASVTSVLLNHVLAAYLPHPELPITDANCASSPCCFHNKPA